MSRSYYRGERIVDQTSGQRAGRHAQTTGHSCSADDRPHHPQREIFAREYCYGWLYIGAWGMGIGAFLIALTFRPYAAKPTPEPARAAG